MAGADKLSRWAKKRPDMFHALDSAVAPSLTALTAWANGRDFTDEARNEFLADVDYQLVAYAHAYGHAIVTLEKSEPLRRSRVKTPDACIALGVPCIDLSDILRRNCARIIVKK